MITVPSRNRVIAVHRKAATKRASGILLPEDTQKKSSSAEIAAVGSDITHIDVGIRLSSRSTARLRLV